MSKQTCYLSTLDRICQAFFYALYEVIARFLGFLFDCKSHWKLTYDNGELTMILLWFLRNSGSEIGIGDVLLIPLKYSLKTLLLISFLSHAFHSSFLKLLLFRKFWDLVNFLECDFLFPDSMILSVIIKLNAYLCWLQWLASQCFVSYVYSLPF